MAQLKYHKFINPNVTGTKNSSVALGSRMVLANNRIGATVYSIGAAINQLAEVQKKRIAFLKKADLTADQRYQYELDVQAETKQEGGDRKGRGEDVRGNERELGNAIKGNKKGKGFIEKFLGPIAGLAESFIRMAIIIPSLQWMNDPKNKDKLTNAVKILQKIFSWLFDWASGSVGLLLDGVAGLFGKDNTWKERFDGFLKVIGGIAGLVALTSLFNPIGLLSGFMDLMDWMFDGLNKKAGDTADEVKTKRDKAKEAVEKNRKTKKYKDASAGARVKSDIMTRYGFKSEEQYQEFLKLKQKALLDKRKKFGPSSNLNAQDLRILADVTKDKFPATLLGKFKKWTTSKIDKARADAYAEVTRRFNQAAEAAQKTGSKAVDATARAGRFIGGWAADRWRQTMNGAKTLKAKWDTTYQALSDLAGKKWDEVKGAALKRIDEMGGPLGTIIKKLKGPLGQRIMKYLPMAGDLLGFVLDVMDGVHWQRALIRTIVGAGIDFGATSLIGALVAATPLTGGSSLALAAALTAAYMGADMMVPGGFRMLIGDPVADFFKIPKFSKDSKSESLDPEKAKAASEAAINAEAAKVAQQVPQEGIRKVEALRRLEKKEKGGKLKLSGNAAKWAEFYEYGKQAGAKYPEVVAAQFALESGWGKSLAARNNFFGIKAGKGESATVSNTREVVNGSSVYINAAFKNFNSPQDAVNHLVQQWYKDYKGYKGINRGNDALHAASLLQSEGYATDPSYARSLQRLMREHKDTTSKVAGGGVEYPPGDYTSTSGKQVVASGNNQETQVSEPEVQDPAQILQSLAADVAKANSKEPPANTEIGPPPSPVGAPQPNENASLLDMAKGEAMRQIDTKLSEAGVPNILIQSVPALLPINIGATINPVYAAVSTPMAMAKTVFNLFS